MSDPEKKLETFLSIISLAAGALLPMLFYIAHSLNRIANYLERIAAK